LLDCATLNGARSLGLAGVTGSLAHGTDADFITVNLSHPTLVGVPDEALLAAVAFSARSDAIQDVAVRGRFIVTKRAHAREPESTRAFQQLMKRLTTQ
jgi:cytosine/adenosine deaminase-related metal-dependent hydrolase